MRKLLAAVFALVLTACTSAPKAPTHVEVVEQAAQTVVALERARPDGAPGFKSFCSGVVVFTGVVITNAHCTEAAEGSQIYLLFRDGTRHKVEKIRAFDGTKEIDLAILHANTSPVIVPAPLEIQRPEVSDPVFAVGHPYGFKWTVTHGTIALRHLTDDESPFAPISWLLANLAVNPGNSGGGVFNERGALVGLATMTNNNGLAFIVPTDLILLAIQSIE